MSSQQPFAELNKRHCRKGAEALTLWMLAALIAWAAACGPDARQATTPLVPTGTPSPTGSNPLPPPSRSRTIAGVVQSKAFVPIAGASVEAIDGPLAGQTVTTDISGRFEFQVSPDVVSGFTFTARATSPRHGTETKQLTCCLTTGSFSLPVDPPSVRIEPGAYDMTLEFDTSCPGIPPSLRTHSFPTAVSEDPRAPAGTRFFAWALALDFVDEETAGFSIGVDGHQIAVQVNWDASMVWTVPPLRYFEVRPDTGLLPYNPVYGGTLRVHTRATYCELTAPLGYGSSCASTPQERVKVRATCDLPGNHVTLTRK